jgi:hypothetical protein
MSGTVPVIEIQTQEGNKYGKVKIGVVHTCVDKVVKHITKRLEKPS